MRRRIRQKDQTRSMSCSFPNLPNTFPTYPGNSNNTYVFLIFNQILPPPPPTPVMVVILIFDKYLTTLAMVLVTLNQTTSHPSSDSLFLHNENFFAECMKFNFQTVL